MRIKLLLVILLLPLTLWAQEPVSVKGRVINSRGEAVEYVQIGIPKLGVGTISRSDGTFEIEIPADTLEFHHVSYQTTLYPVTGAEQDLVITMPDAELPPAVFIGGDTREKYLLRPGSNLLGKHGSLAFSLLTGHIKGVEVGSVAKTKKPFLVQDILFNIRQNYIPGLVVSVNIYRIEGKKEQFINILHKPLYVKIPESDDSQQYHISPEETILLESGKYFISFQIVDYDDIALEEFLSLPEAERDNRRMKCYTSLYFKSSYLRHAALGQMDHISMNIGMTVKGLEYQ